MRYLPHTEQTRQEMLDAIGVSSIDDLFSAVPSDALQKAPLVGLPNQQSEMAVEAQMSAMAAKNHSAADGPFFLGAGCYYHHIPATVDHMIQRSEFLTAYTPYQPEVSQGTLAAMFQFQSYIVALTGQEVANASLYDGATATMEAALMAMRVTRRSNISVAEGLHPQYLETLETYMSQQDVEIQTVDKTNEETACLIVQYPNFRGDVPDLAAYRAQCDATGAHLVVVVTEIISLGMLPAPTEADIVCGEAQSVGVPMGFGGPHLGILACHKKYLRQMPGRLIGETTDEDGKRSFVITLSTREQHIRRERATSNICTNVGLCALAFTVHMSLLGEVGFKHLAQLNHEKACQLADALTDAGFTVENKTFFNEFVVDLGTNAKMAVQKLADQGIIAGYALEGNELLVTATEMTTDEHIEQFISALEAL